MAAAPVAKSSSGLKIVLVLCFCLVVVGAVVVGGTIYAAHRLKQAVIAKAAENGVDLRSIGGDAASSATAGARLPKPCEVLSKQEVSQLIGEPIERTEVQDFACLYYGPPGLAMKLAQDQASGTFKRAQTPNQTVGGTEVANSVDQLVNSMSPQGVPGGDSAMLLLTVAGDGRSQMTAMSATKAIFGGIGQGTGAQGMSMGSDIPGLGDKAIRLPKLGLNVLQGETLIRVIPGPFPDADAKTIALVRAVLPRI